MKTTLPELPTGCSLSHWVVLRLVQETVEQLTTATLRLLDPELKTTVPQDVSQAVLRILTFDPVDQQLEIMGRNQQPADCLLIPAAQRLLTKPAKHSVRQLAEACGIAWEGDAKLTIQAWSEATAQTFALRTRRNGSPRTVIRQIMATTQSLVEISHEMLGLLGPTPSGDFAWQRLTLQLLLPQLQYSIPTMVRDSLQNSSGNWERFVGSENWAAYPAWLDFLAAELGLELPEKARQVAGAGAGWWWPHSDFILISERPVAVEVDADGNFHNETGPAVRYADGFELFFLEGRAVSRQIVMAPETQTIAQIELETNEEVRRLRIERLGWDRYLAASGSKLLDERENVVDGTLEALLETPQHWRILLGTCCTTGRMYAMRVSSDVQTCEQAQAFRAGRRGNPVAAG